MATALDIRAQSLTDFLAWEQQQPERYERVGGVVRTMAGGTIGHNRITLNVAEGLRRGLQGGDCETFVNDVKVVSPDGDVMYPDVVVACGTIPDEATSIPMPLVVVEALSKSAKRWAYLKIPSLKHYVLIAQNEPAVEVATRADDGSWRSVLYEGLEARLLLDALGVEVGLAEIFARITFAAESGEKPPSQVQA
jgi:Uma2 family endonuclease